LQGYGLECSFSFNGKEKIDELNGAGNDLDFGARIYDARLGRWLACDPLAKKYPHSSPFIYSLNTPIGAYDPDGKRVYFIAGAGNDQAGWNYTNRWSSVFNANGIQFKTINASHGSIGDMAFADTYRNKMQAQVKTGYFGSTVTINAIDNKQVQAAADEIIEDITKNNKLEKGEQLNLAGYSYGAILQSYVAIALAEKGYKVDNLILVGSPTSENSDLMKKLTELKESGKIGSIKLEKIPGDKLSNPQNDSEYEEGLKDSAPKSVFGQGDDAAHFDLARPGEKADKKIIGLALKLKKEGIK
jgi:RHS repeat-associated protein